MSLEDKIRTLLESMESDSMVSEETEEDYESLSDGELIQFATQAGLEEMLVMDGEGGLANREEVIRALETLELQANESVVTEADDEESESESEEESEPEETEAEAESEEEAEEETEAEPEEESEPEETEAESEDEAESESEEESEPEVTVVVVSKELEKDSDEDEEEEESFVKDEQFDKMVEAFDLSPEGKEQVRTVFEATIKMHTKQLHQQFEQKYAARQAELESQYESRLIEAKQSASDDLAKLVDGFLTEATDQWIVENALPLEMSVRTELAEQFIDGMKVLFKEHYIDVPEEKLDLLKAQEEKIASVEAKYAKLQEALLAEKQATQKALTEATILKCKAVISEASAGLTSLEKTRFEKLIDEIEFKTVEQFSKKVSQIRESFKATAQPSVKRRQAIVERIVSQREEEAPRQLTDVEIYAQALNSF